MKDSSATEAARALLAARWKKTSKKERSEFAAKVAGARWTNTTAEERSAIAKARWVTRRKNAATKKT